MSSFPESYIRNEKRRVELDFSNYATKSDLEKATAVDTSVFAEKADLATLRSNVNDKIDKTYRFDKIITVPVDLSHVSKDFSVDL